MNKSDTKYVASVGEEDKKRLSLQHEIFAPGTEHFLKKIGLKSGMEVLVVGCGAANL